MLKADATPSMTRHLQPTEFSNWSVVVGVRIIQSIDRFTRKAREANVQRVEVEASHSEDTDHVIVYGEVNGDVVVTDAFEFPAECWSDRFRDHVERRFMEAANP
ncbi:MAG: hypothetical protein LCH70_07575 [Proteobacteria bacterium]|nr:hypothetical protein [Pseudomonadota bacterium]